MKGRKKLSKRTLAKRLKAAESLKGIWADLPEKVQEELMKKTYCICGRDDCPDCGEA